ncbi:MAG: hypothetical protein AAFR04_15850, partial [Pseudomonadota bacterium]
AAVPVPLTPLPSPSPSSTARNRDGSVSPRPAAATAAVAAFGAGTLGGLRSVRSEGLVTGAATTARPGQRMQAAQPDDLKRIRGIGVLIERRLQAAGVTSYAQIANWNDEDVSEISRTLGLTGIAQQNWIEQARILASGGDTEFARRVDRGEVGSSRRR